AEEDAVTCMTVNADAPAAMASECARSEVPFIHFSTDYVFDGRQTRPYVETDPTNPLNVYGRSKRDGEEAIAASGAASFVLRVGSVYDHHHRNFLTTIRRIAQERGEVRVVSDQWCVPTWAGSIAAAVADLAARLFGDPARGSDTRGIY